MTKNVNKCDDFRVRGDGPFPWLSPPCACRGGFQSHSARWTSLLASWKWRIANEPQHPIWRRERATGGIFGLSQIVSILLWHHSEILRTSAT